MVQDKPENFVERVERATHERFADRPVYKIGDVLKPTDGPFPLIDDAYRIESSRGTKWFVIITNPNCHGKASRSLAEKRLKSFLPETHVWSERHRRRVFRSRPLFPRYMFVGLPILDAAGNVDSFTVRRCEGVADLVRCAGAPVSVSETVIGDLMLASERSWFGMTREKEFRDGAHRQLKTEGFMDAFEAILRANPAERMRIFVDMFGQVDDKLLHRQSR